MSQTLSHQLDGFEVRYQSLFKEGRALSFPCDDHGHVDLDALTPAARGNYLFARAMVGREFATPMLLASATGPDGVAHRICAAADLDVLAAVA